MTSGKFPCSWYVDGQKVDESYELPTLSNKISCKDNEHDFQFIEKVKKYIPTSSIEFKYHYVFYCKKCCCIVNMESPI